MTKIKPLSNNVLVEPVSDTERSVATKSGIIIPETVDSAKGGTDQGIIIAVGPGRRDEGGKTIPVSVGEGQKVIFSKYGPDEIKVGDKKYYIISEDNILAIIE